MWLSLYPKMLYYVFWSQAEYWIICFLYTSPGLAWKACLKKTGVKLELLIDPNMLLVFAVHRYAEANNKYMGDKFDPKKLVPNLYGKPNYVIHIQALDQALSHYPMD